jgi:hypothetical protein
VILQFSRFLFAGLLGGASFVAAAQAGADGFLANYVATSYGTGKVELSCPANTRCSPVDAAFALRLGHRFDSAWSMEAGYTDISSDFSLFIQQYSASVKAYSLGAAYTLPLSNSFSAVLRGGLSSNKLRFQPPYSPGDVQPHSVITRSTKPYVGVAASWQFARRWSAHLDADWTRADMNVGGSNNPQQTHTVRFYGAGVAFHF